MDNNKLVEIVYINWQGKLTIRKIRPYQIYFGSTEFHPDQQWLLDAFDEDKKEDRTFAMKDIRTWRPLTNE